jgi:hypothetical protein
MSLYALAIGYFLLITDAVSDTVSVVNLSEIMHSFKEAISCLYRTRDVYLTFLDCKNLFMMSEKLCTFSDKEARGIKASASSFVLWYVRFFLPLVLV